MTTFASQSVACGNCGHVFNHPNLGSTYTFGSPDLDTRPPELQRSTMHAWIQGCPSCGYCSRDVAEFDHRLRPVLESAKYRSQLTDTVYPELTSTFICAGMLVEAAGRQADAGWAYLQAAWSLDDANKEELARVWRGKAADKFLGILNDGKLFAEELGASEVIVTDCLRRLGRGTEALQVIERGLSQSYDDVIHKILTFERALIQRGDTGRHLVKEAFEAGQTAVEESPQRGLP
jgi:hypothetical protein